MEVWFTRATVVLLAFGASVARADPPSTTVVFGSPAAEQRVVEAEPSAPARTDAPREPSSAVDAPRVWTSVAAEPGSASRVSGAEPVVARRADAGGSPSSRASVARAGAAEPAAGSRDPSGAPDGEPSRLEPARASDAHVAERSGANAEELAALRDGASAGTECPRAITIVRRIGRGTERVRMPLLDCHGQPREDARRAISMLARARSVEERPTEDDVRAWRERDGDPSLLADGVRLLHPGLLERLQRIGEAFDPHPIEIVSGYRPEAPSRSRHHHARALDIVVRGAPREELRDLAVTFQETGVGWYPNSTFVHVDVREESAYWVDLSAPGERPRYVRGAEPPGATPSDPGGDTAESSDGLRIDEALDLVRRGVRVAIPSGNGGAADDASRGETGEGRPPSDEELARMRRETEAALRAITVPAM